MATYVLVEGRKWAIEISKKGLGLPPMWSLVHMRACLVIAARRHAGTRNVSQLGQGVGAAAGWSVAGGDVCVCGVCAVKMKV